jgi:putative PIN family toxin of toxin-antitoxin system
VKIVLDTVIYVRALINPKGRWGRLVFEVGRRHTVVTSPEILREVIEVIQRQEVRNKLPLLAYPARLEAVLGVLRESTVVEPSERPAVCRDADDDKFFWCALAASADYIISEDRDVLDVSKYEGSRTISAADFLELGSK